jgi:hypothetical protein
MKRRKININSFICNKTRKAPEILQQSRGFAEDPEGILQQAPLLPCILFVKTVPGIFAQPAIQNN